MSFAPISPRAVPLSVLLLAAGLVAGLIAGPMAGPATAAELTQDEVRELEGLLASLGFDPGPIDGIADGKTATAIETYQSFAALRVDGEASPALLEELRGVTQSLEQADEDAPADAEPPAAEPETAAGAAPSDGGGDRAIAADEPEPAAPSARGGSTGPAVHLASFRHREKAEEEWQRLLRMLPNLMSDMEPSIEEIDLGEEGRFFRLYARPFPNQATARDFCLMIVEEGYNCRVANTGDRQTSNAEPAAEDDPAAEDPLEDPLEDAPEDALEDAPEDAPEAKDGTEADPAPAANDAAEAKAVPELEDADPQTALAPGKPVGRVDMNLGRTSRPGGAARAPTVLIVANRFPDGSAGRGSVPYPQPSAPSEIGALTDDPNVSTVAAAPSLGALDQEARTAPRAEDATEVYTTATAAFRSGDCTAAVRSYTQAFSTGGLSRQALATGHNNRGLCLYLRARYDEALADFDQAIANDGKFAAAYYNRGRARNAIGDRDQAMADFNTAYDLGFGPFDAEP